MLLRAESIYQCLNAALLKNEWGLRCVGQISLWQVDSGDVQFIGGRLPVAGADTESVCLDVLCGLGTTVAVSCTAVVSCYCILILFKNGVYKACIYDRGCQEVCLG